MAHWEIVETLIYKLIDGLDRDELKKARTTYEHLINSTTDSGIIETLSFLREREVVHSQRRSLNINN